MKILPVKLLYPGLLAAALLSAGAGVVYADYNSCRCGQPAPGVDIPDICCKNNFIDNNGVTYGTDGDERCCPDGGTWSKSEKRCCRSPQVLASGVCKTPCAASCPAGQTRTTNSYSEDSGGCCKAEIVAICMAMPVFSSVPMNGYDKNGIEYVGEYGFISGYTCTDGAKACTTCPELELNRCYTDSAFFNSNKERCCTNLDLQNLPGCCGSSYQYGCVYESAGCPQGVQCNNYIPKCFNWFGNECPASFVPGM